MKKIIPLFLAVLLAALCLCACGASGETSPNKTANSTSLPYESSSDKASDSTSIQNETTPGKTSDDSSFQIVTTIFPEYDWVQNLLGDNPANAQVTLLLDSGVDLHSFQPTADDIMTVANCDMFIYVGGESDDWVADALQEAVNDDMIVINLLDTLGGSVKEEEMVEGMQPEEADGDEIADRTPEEKDGDEMADRTPEEEDGDETAERTPEEEDGSEVEKDEPEYDEHVWLSLKQTSVLCRAISDALCQMDPDNTETYQANAAAYIERLQTLDAAYSEATAAAPVKTILFGDRFPFRYLADDYGLTYYAAFAGCSAETEASFETITFLAQKTDELGLKHVMTLEGTDHKIAETIIANTKTKDQDILPMDSMQSVTAADVAAGADYLAIMEQNLAVLKQALQ